MELLPEQIHQCDALLRSVEDQLPTVNALQQRRGHRAIAALLMRLGRFTESLAQVERGQDNQPRDVYRACGLALKTICLFRLNRLGEARAAQAEAESIMKRLLPDPLNGYEGFLTEDERLYLALLEEANALSPSR